jgi:hypothetical protein
MTNHAAAVTKRIQKILENKLTSDYIMPLLENLGYHKVEFFGGTSEDGKDIIFWERDKLDEIRLFVAQVKHFKFNNTASDKKALLSVVNQIGQCFNRSLPYSDKTMHRPAEVFLITTYPVDSKTLATRFGDYPHLKDQQIRIIDGTKLGELLIKHRPDSVKRLLGLDYEIKSKIQPSLNNKVLLAALGHREEKELKSIYTDIDFSLGKVSTNLFFHSHFQPSLRKLELNRSELALFKGMLNRIKDQYELSFLDKTFGELELHLREDVNQDELDQRIAEASIAYNNSGAKVEKSKKAYYEQKERQGKFEFENSDHHNLREWQDLVKFTDKAHDQSLKTEREHQRVKADFEGLMKRKNLQFLKVELSGQELVSQILAKRTWIEDQVAAFNILRPGHEVLRNFITQCQDIIDTTGLILKNQRFFSCIGIEDQRAHRKNFESTRFKLPIDHIFDTGLNFAVLGEAGAGKTTSLQMYVFNRQDISDKLIIWLPLARVIQSAIQDNENLNDPQIQDNFELIIFNHFVRIGILVTWEEFILHLKSRKIILLFDGIDEAIKPAPWLPRVINKLAIKYKENAQVIVTSRMSGKYLEEIPFFAVTLLPFTPEQRDKFIEQWFAEVEDRQTINKIKRHLKEHKAIGDVITNPLLATTLCVLAKHQLPLPKTEINLYDNRIKLLTGHYDNMKRIDSRISVSPQLLEALAQKLAFYLHSNNKREDYISALESSIRKIVMYEIDGNEAIIALNELVDPCNLLMPMTDDGKFGFGHLKYQEHLAARELVSNRGIDVLPLLKHPWWRETLILVARMTRDLTWLIRLVGAKEQCTEFEPILQEMINVRPKFEQLNLESLFKKYILLENNQLFADRSVVDNDDFISNNSIFDDDDNEKDDNGNWGHYQLL